MLQCSTISTLCEVLQRAQGEGGDRSVSREGPAGPRKLGFRRYLPTGPKTNWGGVRRPFDQSRAAFGVSGRYPSLGPLFKSQVFPMRTTSPLPPSARAHTHMHTHTHAHTTHTLRQTLTHAPTPAVRPLLPGRRHRDLARQPLLLPAVQAQRRPPPRCRLGATPPRPGPP
jgi:hypothetical protein